MPYETPQSIVLIVDALELRRAGITSLINTWARQVNLNTEGISPEELPAYSAKVQSVQLIILSIGGSSLHETAIQEHADKIAELFPGIPCAVISDRNEAEEAVLAATLGEQAFLSTSMQPDMACQALTFILGGGTYFPREALLQSASNNATSRTHTTQLYETDGDGLTKRQYEVLEKLRLGKSNKHIARDLNMQELTVKVHVRQIMRKLGAANRTQAALFASSTFATHGGLRMDEAIPLPYPKATILPTVPSVALPAEVIQTAAGPVSMEILRSSR